MTTYTDTTHSDTTDTNPDTQPDTDRGATAVIPAGTPVPEGHDWRVAGDAWGHRAADWASLFEHYATDAIHAILDQTAVAEGSRLLDLACGSGLAIRYAESRGAVAAGIDASATLTTIATERNPEADIRLGTIFELPWPDESFDVVTAINGIWGGCEAALAEAYRVLRPGGAIALSFWGGGPPLDLGPIFASFAYNAPEAHLKGMVRTNGIAHPGVAEEMLASAGFTDLERDQRISAIEWPDAELAWRALASTGPAVPALRAVGEEVLRPQVLEALEQCRQPSGLYRLRNDHQIVVGHKEP